MRNRLLRGVALATMIPIGLSACDKDRGSGMVSVPAPTPTPVATTPAPTGTFQSLFGSAFAAVFNASPTAAPIDPTAADVPALNATAAPLDN